MSQANLQYWGQAVMSLNPQVTYMTDWVNAWDAQNNPVEYDHDAANIRADELMLEAELAACTAQAKALIAASDWSVLPDVNLTNKADFESYRATLRNLILNPVVNPVWPVEPQPVWGS